ncbi:MAG: hypothetical protein H7270_14735 [Dermatophilaceae bacterium]|nr:hypothetical protein [Dermatophilaceae bacterium]
MNDSDRRRSPDGFDDDAIFADIIAHLKDEESAPEQPVRPTGPTGPVRPVRPTAGDTSAYRGTTHQTPVEAGDPPAEDAADETTPQQGEPEDVSQGESQAVPAPQGWRAYEIDDKDNDEDEHFEPRPVTPLPVGDLQFWAILAGMIGGPLLLLYLVFFNREMSSYWTLTAIAMSVGGFGLLVSRLPGKEGDDDDGARL